MAGIYIHIPFCKQACSYCDFHFTTTFDKYRGSMIDALCQELFDRKKELGNYELKSIYFGGGTPSLLRTEELVQILDTVAKNYSISSHCEKTLEANPDDISEEKLESWKTNGINRLSIGVQSFLNQDLIWMNRAHNADQAIKALTLVKKAAMPMSLDLMYGLPDTSHQHWLDNIQKALSFCPEHISAYCLTIEPKTSLHRQVMKGEVQVCSEEEQAEQFNTLVSILKKNSYEQYEISNFARDEHYAIHNTAYWHGSPYLGVGPSAHSYDGAFERKWNINNNNLYIKGIETKKPIFENEILTPKDLFNELILTGLRTKWGVSIQELEQLIPLSTRFKETKEQYAASDHLMANKNYIWLTEKGKLIADRIASDLFY